MSRLGAGCILPGRAGFQRNAHSALDVLRLKCVWIALGKYLCYRVFNSRRRVRCRDRFRSHLYQGEIMVIRQGRRPIRKPRKRFTFKGQIKEQG